MIRNAKPRQWLFMGANDSQWNRTRFFLWALRDHRNVLNAMGTQRISRSRKLNEIKEFIDENRQDLRVRLRAIENRIFLTVHFVSVNRCRMKFLSTLELTEASNCFSLCFSRKLSRTTRKSSGYRSDRKRIVQWAWRYRSDRHRVEFVNFVTRKKFFSLLERNFSSHRGVSNEGKINFSKDWSARCSLSVSLSDFVFVNKKFELEQSLFPFHFDLERSFN